MSQAAFAGIDKGTSETLSSIRSKLQQLMDSVWITHAMLAEQGNAALLPWPEILARYTLLLSHTHAIVTQLVQPPYNDESSPAWNKTLSTSVFAPVASVDTQKEAMVNGFLSPNQPPYVLEEAARVIETLPASLRVPRPQPQTDLDEEITPEQQAQFEKLQNAIETHNTLISDTLKHVKKLRAGAMAEDEPADGMEIDEFGIELDQDEDIPGYVWNMRLAEDEDEHEEKEGDEAEEGFFGTSNSHTGKNEPRTVNLTEVASFLRDGRKGSSFYRALFQ